MRDDYSPAGKKTLIPSYKYNNRGGSPLRYQD